MGAHRKVQLMVSGGIRSGADVAKAMVFVRNPTGVSHSPDEYAEPSDCNIGAVAPADIMAAWVTG